MTKAGQQADELARLVKARTGLTRDELACPREKSWMTPCIARDGALCVAEDVCVGCGVDVAELLAEEKGHPR